MVLAPGVRMSETIKERQEEVKEAVKTGEPCRFLYCITLPSNEKNLLDIHPYRELRKRKEYEIPFVIVGLTASRKEAFEMAAAMASQAALTMETPSEFQKTFRSYRDSLLEKKEDTGKE